MKLIVTTGQALRGEIDLPGDKSLSHRAALFAALAEGQSRIERFLVSGVTRPMLAALTALGVAWQLEGSRLSVDGRGWQNLCPPVAPLDCGNSATTLRMLAGAVAAAGVPAVLDGSAGLRRRPMDRIVDPLRRMGVPVEAGPGECAPLRMSARPAGQRLKAIEYSLPVASAQVKTCLLLAGLAADGPVVLSEPGPSRDHTEKMLASMGLRIASENGVVRMEPPDRPLRPFELSLPGDFSSASFLMVAALITPGSEVILRHVGLNPTRTGLLEALLRMGANIQVTNRCQESSEPYGDLVVRASHLRGTRVEGDLGVRMIDEFPIFAVAASFAAGKTDVRGVEELRHKESDRISALCLELRGLGVDVSEAKDGFSIRGGVPLGGQTVDPHGDHRLAMSLAVAGLASTRPVTVQGAEIVSESFPEFTGALAALGANVEMREE